MNPPKISGQDFIGVGLYTVADASSLLRIPERNVRRWLAGYPFRERDGSRKVMPPLWTPQLPANDRQIELGFRDLIELRFVSAFMDQGLGLYTVRRCLELARDMVGDERPFSTRRFHTDGLTIFLALIAQALDDTQVADPDLSEAERSSLIDLRSRQYVFKTVLSQSFKDLDLDDDAVTRWRPFHGKPTIVIDPKRAFGRPIATDTGVPTRTLSDAVEAEGSEKRVAHLFDVPRSVVADAVAFEREFAAA